MYLGGVYHHFYQVSRLSLYGHTGVLGSGRSPLVQAFGAGQGCVPVLPLDQCDMHSRPDPGSLPQDHPGSGLVAPWLPPGQLHGISSTSPCIFRSNNHHHITEEGLHGSPGQRS